MTGLIGKCDPEYPIVSPTELGVHRKETVSGVHS
jgi:hypothetical protein